MNSYLAGIVYLCVGALGGWLGAKTKLPTSALWGSVIAVILFRLLLAQSWVTPKRFSFFGQVVLGVLIALTYTPGMMQRLLALWAPLVASSLVLLLAGFLAAMACAKLGYLDFPTAYIATSPGAMNALVPLAVDLHADAAVVAAFHFFRILLVSVAAPVAFYLLRAYVS